MEYVDGRGLDEMIGEDVGPIPWEKALPLFSQILDGIGYAHAQGIIHRDIKPSNILISKTGVVKIADFGIAKLARENGVTKTGVRLGTLHYESPEQIRGLKSIDHRADIYSLGMTLYEMLAGQLPFDDKSNSSEYTIMDSIVNRSKELDPRDYYPHIPQWLVAIIIKATSIEVDNRFRNCAEFKKQIIENMHLSGNSEGFWLAKVKNSAEIVSPSISSNMDLTQVLPKAKKNYLSCDLLA